MGPLEDQAKIYIMDKDSVHAISEEVCIWGGANNLTKGFNN